MQPGNPQRPVMDISTSRRPVSAPSRPPAPSGPPLESPATATPDFSKAPSLPVHEAPQSDDSDRPEQHADPAADQSAARPVQAEAAPVPVQSPAQRHDQTPLPVGAITGTILIMIALSAAAILVYINTK